MTSRGTKRVEIHNIHHKLLLIEKFQIFLFSKMLFSIILRVMGFFNSYKSFLNFLSKKNVCLFNWACCNSHQETWVVSHLYYQNKYNFIDKFYKFCGNSILRLKSNDQNPPSISDYLRCCSALGSLRIRCPIKGYESKSSWNKSWVDSTWDRLSAEWQLSLCGYGEFIFRSTMFND